MPIIGITASSITASVLGDYESIATVSVTTATTASIEFTNIPSTYQHLQIRAITLSSSAGAAATMRFNNDTTTSNYRGHLLYGTGASAVSNTDVNQLYSPQFLGGTTSPGSAIIDILDYANTNKNTVVRALDGYDANGSGYIELGSGLWLNTAAVTSIKFSYTSFSQYCQFALYGIK